MSKSDRDQRGRPHSGKHCPEAQSGGCIYCVTGEYKEPARRSARQRQASFIAEGLGDESQDPYEPVELFEAHVYVTNRCVRCNVDYLDYLDASLPGLESCPGKQDDESIFYSTATGENPVASHAIIERPIALTALNDANRPTWWEQLAEPHNSALGAIS